MPAVSMLVPSSSPLIMPSLSEPTVVCAGVALIEATNPLQEVLCAPLLKQAHQGALKSLAGIRGHLRNCGLGSVSLLYVATGDLLEFQVSCDIGGDQDVGELAVAHQELRDEVDVPVVDPAVLLPWLGTFLVVAVSLEKSLEVDGGRLAAVVVVAVDVEHLLALDGEHAREHTLGQAGAQDDHVVFRSDLIHVCVDVLKASDSSVNV